MQTQLQASGADEGHAGHLAPLNLGTGFELWDSLSELVRARVMAALRADQRRRDEDARRHGRDPLAEAISAHIEACARLGVRPLVGPTLA